MSGMLLLRSLRLSEMLVYVHILKYRYVVGWG